ncbi:MAG: YciI family protein [Caulobacteraceae bacterium]|nr:YciI family protein [Caulobacteraceae bacterium]
MATFVLTCTDHPDALERRMQARPAHLEYVRANLGKVKLAGALLSDAGEMAGSMFIIEAESKAEVEAFCAKDPYVLADVFARTEIRQIRMAVGVLT